MSDNFELDELLKHLSPELNEDTYIFCSVAHQPLAELERYQPLALYKEAEGLSLVVSKTKADEMALAYSGTFSLISLRVHSDLHSVGLSAAVSTALAKSGISCNIIAGFYHDHLFVPCDRAKDAMALLWDLSMDNFPHP